MQENNKQKGLLTETKCLLSLLENKIEVSIPYGDNSRYDFIIDINNVLYKVQCKTSRKTKSNAYEISTSSNNWKTKEKRNYKNEIDFFITIVEDNCYLIPIKDVGNQNTFSMRILPPLNNQKITSQGEIHYAQNYELEKMLERYNNN